MITATPVAAAISVSVSAISVSIAGAGSAATNTIGDTVVAAIEGGSTVSGANVLVKASDTASIKTTAVAASISVSAGADFSLGVAGSISLALNDVSENVTATIDASSVTAAAPAGTVSVIAETKPTLDAVAVGVAIAVAASGGLSGAVALGGEIGRASCR